MRKVGIAAIHSVIWAEISQQAYKSIALHNIFRDISLNTKPIEMLGILSIPASQDSCEDKHSSNCKVNLFFCFPTVRDRNHFGFYSWVIISFQKTLFEFVIYMIPGELLLKWASYSSLAWDESLALTWEPGFDSASEDEPRQAPAKVNPLVLPPGCHSDLIHWVISWLFIFRCVQTSLVAGWHFVGVEDQAVVYFEDTSTLAKQTTYRHMWEDFVLRITAGCTYRVIQLFL